MWLRFYLLGGTWKLLDVLTNQYSSYTVQSIHDFQIITYCPHCIFIMLVYSVLEDKHIFLLTQIDRAFARRNLLETKINEYVIINERSHFVLGKINTGKDTCSTQTHTAKIRKQGCNL